MANNVLAIRRPWTRVWVGGAAVVAVTLLLVTIANAHPHKKHDKRVVEIISEGPFLGITMQELTDALREGLNAKAKGGVLVNSVVEGSAAEKAGIEEGDIIVEFDGKKVTSPKELRDAISEKEIGDEVKLKYVREGKSQSAEVALGDWADHSPMVFSDSGERFRMAVPHGGDVRAMIANLRPRRLGVRVHSMDEDLASYFGVKQDEGLLVLGVEEETTAQSAGIKAGDVIVKVGESNVASADDIHEAMSALEKGDKIDVTVVRKKKRVKLEGEVQEAQNVWVDEFPREMRRHWQQQAPRVHQFKDELREEVEQLRKELDELKEELNKS